MLSPPPIVRLDTDDRHGDLLLQCPSHPAMQRFAHQHEGIWFDSPQHWRFPIHQRLLLEHFLLEHYGSAGKPVPTTNVRITARKDITAVRRPVFALGREVAIAHGRDTGARPGPGTLILHGSSASGGSRAYCTTIVYPGTVLELREVPDSLLPPFDQAARSDTLFPWAPSKPTD